MSLKRCLSLTNIRTKKILKVIDEFKNYKNNIVLFGSVGTGKTTLLNRLCNTNFSVKDKGYSCTRKVQHGYSKRFDMVIFDFPGLNAVEDPVGHLKTQLISLSNMPIRMICLVVQYSSRNDDYERELSQLISVFYKYINNITIIVTKSESANEIIKNDIEFLFKERFNVKNVLFTTYDKNFYILCEELNNIQLKMENIERIEIRTRDLAKHVPSLYNKNVMEDRTKLEDEFYDILETFENELQKANDNDLKKALYFCFKNYKENLLNSYAILLENKIVDGKKLDDNSIITEVLMFNNLIYNDFNKFKKKVENLLEVKINNYNGEFNKFKKCPHCGIIWFKVKGCDSVMCGTRTKIRDTFFGRMKNYVVQLIGKLVVINTTSSDNENFDNDNEFYGLTLEEKITNEKRKIQGKTLIKPIGCGARLNWREMEDVSEDSIKKLKDIMIDNEDYYKGFLRLSEEYDNYSDDD